MQQDPKYLETHFLNREEGIELIGLQPKEGNGFMFKIKNIIRLIKIEFSIIPTAWVALNYEKAKKDHGPFIKHLAELHERGHCVFISLT